MTSRNGHITGRELELMERLATYEGQIAETSERLGGLQTALESERLFREELIRREVEARVREMKAALAKEAEARIAGALAERERTVAEREEAVCVRESETETLRRKLDERAASFDNLWKEREAAMEESFAARIRGLESSFDARVAKAVNECRRRSGEIHDSLVRSFVDSLKAIPGASAQAKESIMAGHTETADKALAELGAEVAGKINSIAAYSRKKLSLIGYLARQQFGRRSERAVIPEERLEKMQKNLLESSLLDAQKLELYKNALAEHNRAKAILREIEKKERRDGHGQNVIPDSVPVSSRKVITPQVVLDNPGLYRKIGESTTAILHKHTSYTQSQTVRETYVLIDPPANPELPEIASSIPDDADRFKTKYSNSVRTGVAVSKYVDHIPLASQEKITAREGFGINRSTMTDFVDNHADLYLRPLFPLLEREVMKSPHIAADGVPMKVVVREEGKTAARYMVAIRSLDTGAVIFRSHINEKENGDAGKKKKKSGRSKDVLKSYLDGWIGGAIMCDGYMGYNWIAQEGKGVVCRCGAHCRREFEEAGGENPQLAEYPLMLFQMIFGTEEYIKWALGNAVMRTDEITSYRHTFAEPVWIALKAWCVSELAELPEGSRMRQACNYLIRYYDELTNYLDIPEMPLENNGTEREIRGPVMVRKNSLFCQSEEALSRDTLYYSFFATCKVNGRNPEKWLNYVADNFETTPVGRLHTLLPQYWIDPSDAARPRTDER